MTAPKFWLDDNAPNLVRFDNEPQGSWITAEEAAEAWASLPTFEMEESMPAAPKAFTHEPINAPRGIAWGFVIIAATLAALACILGGCSNARELEAAHIIIEAKTLLEKPYPGAPRWESRKTVFQSDADKWLSELEASNAR